MSFGYSIGDFILLTTLAYKTFQNARSACGAHDSLTKEVGSLHIVLKRLQIEVSKPDSLLNRDDDHRKRELATLARDCKGVLKVLSQILEKYNKLSVEKKSVTKLWQMVKFGNGEMLDLGKIRTEVLTYTQALTLFLNLLSIGTLGKIEVYMDSHGDDLRDIKQALHWVTASMQAESHGEKSILTSYTEDDKGVWKNFRRELIAEGFSSRLLERHKKTIKRYVMELGERGALDEILQESEPIGSLTPVTVARSSSGSANNGDAVLEAESDNGTEMEFDNTTPEDNLEESGTFDENILGDAETSLGEPSALDSNHPGRISTFTTPSAINNADGEADVPDVDIEDELDNLNASNSEETEESDYEDSRPGPSHNRGQTLRTTQQAIQNVEHPLNTKPTDLEVEAASNCRGNAEYQSDNDLASGGDLQSLNDGEELVFLEETSSQDQKTASHNLRSTITSRATNNAVVRMKRPSTSNHAYMEEVEDEEFLPGAHPNCEITPNSNNFSETSVPTQKAPEISPKALSNHSTAMVQSMVSEEHLFDNTLVCCNDDYFEDALSLANDEKPTKRRSPFGKGYSYAFFRDSRFKKYRLKVEREARRMLRRYRFEATEQIFRFEDSETREKRKIHGVLHFANFDFSSGPEDLSDTSLSGIEKDHAVSQIKRLSGEQEQSFEQWLRIQRGYVESQKILSKDKTKYPSKQNAAWGSASEREDAENV